MKIKLSPMLVEVSGSAGPIVGSRWKGIAYLRSRITPANPKTDKQTAHRARLKKLVNWWRGFESQLKNYIGTLATGLQMSGFNLYMSRNLYLISEGTASNPKSAEDPEIVPPGSDVDPLETLSGSTGSGSKEVDLSWTKSSPGSDEKVYVLAGESDSDGTLPSSLSLIEKDTTLVSAGNKTYTMDKAGTYYYFLVLVEDTSNDHFSKALKAVVQSGG